jgi:amino acid adenylation domain-containing protein
MAELRRRWAYLVQHYGDLSATAHPDACALRCPRDGTLTYGALYRRSNRLARALAAAGVARQARVALCLERSAASVVAMLGVLKADAIYVPIHEKAPPDRCRTILADCQPAAVVVDARTAGRVADALRPAGDTVPLVVLGDAPGEVPARTGRWITQGTITRQSDAPLDYHNVDTDIAHILYTSGTTGRPKGVMISHLNVVNYVEWAVEYFGITQTDRILGTAPFHFDMSTFDLYCSQKAGAALCLATEEHTLFPSRLMQLAEREGITLWKGVASLLAYLARTGAVQRGRLPTLERVLFSGERLPTRALMTWMGAFPEKRFYNVYGPTEATGISTAYHVEHRPEHAGITVPVGRPCANTEVLVLTDSGEPTPIGEAGEICIRGSSLSPGYWNDPVRTQQAFAHHPRGGVAGDRVYRTGDLGHWDADGQLRLVGRRDDQVKWMGYRIELGEITVALQAVPGVVDAAVHLLPVRGDDAEQLVAFVVPAAGATDAGILATLRGRLPHYMVPKRLVSLPALPRTDRGKVDREALRRLYCSLEPA